jgi:hypothetical protein
MIRESDLFPNWVPFCRDAKLLSRRGNTDQVHGGSGVEAHADPPDLPSSLTSL